MNVKDKISKNVWALFDSAKDSVKTNVVNAIKNKQIMVEAASVQVLLSLIDASLDEGYHRGHNVFERTIDAVLIEESKKQAVTPSKKK